MKKKAKVGTNHVLLDLRSILKMGLNQIISHRIHKCNLKSFKTQLFIDTCSLNKLMNEGTAVAENIWNLCSSWVLEKMESFFCLISTKSRPMVYLYSFSLLKKISYICSELNCFIGFKLIPNMHHGNFSMVLSNLRS